MPSHYEAARTGIENIEAQAIGTTERVPCQFPDQHTGLHANTTEGHNTRWTDTANGAARLDQEQQ